MESIESIDEVLNDISNSLEIFQRSEWETLISDHLSSRETVGDKTQHLRVLSQKHSSDKRSASFALP
jgi:hypothetical protein